MKHKLKKFITVTLVLSVTLIFAIGLIFTAEIIGRATGLINIRSSQIDVTLFPYKHYVVTTHPNNLVLGKSKHLLEGFFGKNVCSKDGVTAKFNSDGFRTHEFRDVPPKEPEEIRILITGGSASISWNIGEACTLDSNLYRLFEKHYPNQKIRIFNLGNGAWKSFQELIAIQLYGLKLQPDLIIVFDGFNDIQHSYSMPIEQPYSIAAETAFKRYQKWVNGSVSELFNNLKIIHALKQPARLAVGMIGRTKNAIISDVPQYAEEAQPGKLATKMEYPLNITAIKNRKDFDPYNQKVVNFYLQNEKLIAKAAESVGSKIIFVLQPTLYHKTPLSEAEKGVLKSYEHSVNFVVQGYARMHEGLEHLANSDRNISFYDMSNIFKDDTRSYFGDYCHFNKEGYEIVADKLFIHISKVLNLK